MTSQLLTEKEAAKILCLSVQTLRNDRGTLRRFPFVKLGRSVRYRPEDLDAVVAAGRVTRDGGGAR